MLGSERRALRQHRKISKLAFDRPLDCGSLFLCNNWGVESSHNVIPATLAKGNLDAEVCGFILDGGIPFLNQFE